MQKIINAVRKVIFINDKRGKTLFYANVAILF
jgi:hypothetical protein